jgi:hypothetical protein
MPPGAPTASTTTLRTAPDPRRTRMPSSQSATSNATLKPGRRPRRAQAATGARDGAPVGREGQWLA